MIKTLEHEYATKSFSVNFHINMRVPYRKVIALNFKLFDDVYCLSRHPYCMLKS